MIMINQVPLSDLTKTKKNYHYEYYEHYEHYEGRNLGTSHARWDQGIPKGQGKKDWYHGLDWPQSLRRRMVAQVQGRLPKEGCLGRTEQGGLESARHCL